MHEKLLKLISPVIPPSERKWCLQYFEPTLFPKNRVIEEEGMIPKYLYFVVSGYLRLFHYNDYGDEVTTHINCPPGFITSYFNFINQTKSNENLECITECKLLRISKNNLDILTEKSTLFKNFSISVYQQSLVYNDNRSKELATLSGKERYRKFIKDYSHILQNVPLQYIASFLGMDPKSLSRIRKESHL